MITLIHGDDTQKVWAKYAEITSNGIPKTDIDLKKTTVEELQDTLAGGSLFGTNRLVSVTNLKSLHHTRRKTFFKNVENYQGENTTDIIIVSDTTLEEKSLGGFKFDRLYAFPLPKYFFEYLDALTPGRARAALDILAKMQDTGGEQTFYATVTRVRLLILEKSNNSSSNEELSKLSPFYEKKLRAQSRPWHKDALISFFNDLFEIEKGLKSSNLPLSVASHLDIALHKHLK